MEAIDAMQARAGAAGAADARWQLPVQHSSRMHNAAPEQQVLVHCPALALGPATASMGYQQRKR